MPESIVLWPHGPERPANEWAGADVVVEAGTWLPGWDYTPPVEEWEAPDVVDLTRPKMIQLAVSTIRNFRWLGEIIQARIVPPRPISLDGTGSIRVEVPTSDITGMLTLCDDVEDWGTADTGVLKIVDRAIHPVIDGRVCPGYVLRGEATIRDGMLTLVGQEPPRLFADRIMGEGQREDLLGGRGTFPGTRSWQSLGFQAHNGLEVEWVADGGVRGGRALRIRGDQVAGDELTITAHYTQPEGVTNQQITVRSGAFFNIPESATDDTTVMVTEVFEGGVRVSPPQGYENDYSAQVVEDTPRGEYGRNPMTSAALLPVPPYSVAIITTIYPKSTTEWTYISDLTVFRRDTFSSGVPRDLTAHPALLIRKAQDKSSWSLPVDIGSSTGVEEMLVVRAEDESPLTDELAKVCDRDDGPDWPWVDARWRCQSEARRGAERTTVVLGPDDILESSGWSHDPGGQKSEMRGLTDRGEAYWRVTEVVRDTSHTDGHVIEAQVRAPNDMSLKALAEFTASQLAGTALPQETCTVKVRGWLARRLEVGDSFRTVQVDGHYRMDRHCRLTGQDWYDDEDTCDLTLAAWDEP